MQTKKDSKAITPAEIARGALKKGLARLGQPKSLMTVCGGNDNILLCMSTDAQLFEEDVEDCANRLKSAIHMTDKIGDLEMVSLPNIPKN